MEGNRSIRRKPIRTRGSHLTHRKVHGPIRGPYLRPIFCEVTALTTAPPHASYHFEKIHLSPKVLHFLPLTKHHWHVLCISGFLSRVSLSRGLSHVRCTEHASRYPGFRFHCLQVWFRIRSEVCFSSCKRADPVFRVLTSAPARHRHQCRYEACFVYVLLICLL